MTGFPVPLSASGIVFEVFVDSTSTTEETKGKGGLIH